MLVVGWHDVPWRPRRRRHAEGFFVSEHVVVPAVAFVEVAEIEFPVLFRFVDTLEKPFALLGLRHVEPELQYQRALLREIALVVGDRSQAVGPQLGRRWAR